MTSFQFPSGDPIADRRAHYARMYAEARDYRAAEDLQVQALELAPGWAAGWHALGNYREKAGDLRGAAEAWRKVLEHSPTDIFGAGLKLSLTGQAATPAAPPAEYVEALFDGYSRRFDNALIETLHYRVPELLMAMLAEISGGDPRFAKVIDLGCGTGLFGERVRKTASWLEGYDLSHGMLTKAQEKGVYDHLGQANIGFGLGPDVPQTGIRADLVAAADVFAYFGDLDGVVGIASGLMQPGGHLAFSCEAGPDDVEWRLQPSLRYCHGAAYLRALIERHGLAIVRFHREPIRLDGGLSVDGFLVIARKPAGTCEQPVMAVLTGPDADLAEDLRRPAAAGLN